MLDLARCKILRDKNIKIATGYEIVQEGTPLVSILENGEEAVRPSLGTADDKVFAGVSYGEMFSPVTKSIVQENIVIPIVGSGNPTVQLSKNNLLTGQIAVYDHDKSGGAGYLTLAGAPGSNQYTLNATTGLLTFDNTAQGGHKITVYYRYYPTVQEQMSIENWIPLRQMASSDFLGQIGVIHQGEIYTDQVDMSKNWATATEVRLGDGVFTDQTASTGLVVSKNIIQVPTADVPFLGFRV